MNNSQSTITILGIEFPFEPRYSEGHQLTPGEAHILNTALADRLRNNFSAKVKAKQDDPSGLIAEFTEYAASYEFAPPANPTEVLAKKLATEAISAHLRSKGIDPKSRSDEWFEAQVMRVLDQKPYYREEAARRIESTREAASELLEGVELA